MANGGWHGTSEEWSEAEAPLIEVDNIICDFSSEFNLSLTKNHKDYPSRSMVWWNNNIRCLVNIYAASLDDLTWKLWLCASEDREKGYLWWQTKERYSQSAFLIENEIMSSFKVDLPNLLRSGREKINYWCQHPEDLELTVRYREI